jgi:hypothetical protein
MHILFLVSRHYYEQKMSRCRFHQMAAVGRYEGMQVTVWGNGFPHYDEAAPLHENITRQFGATAVDLVHVYKPGEHKAVAACPLPKSIDYNEAWDRQATMKEIVQNDIRLIVFHHQNDLAAWHRRTRLSHGRLLIYIPHAAERAIFAPAARPWPQRTVPVLLTGSLGSKFYPLRTRCAELMRSGRLPGELRPHPGYRTQTAADTRDQFVDYAQHLGRSRIALVCGIKFDYALAKYPEAAMAGCLLIGDVPRELHHTLGRYMVQIDPDMPDGQIVKEIQWWVEHDDEARELAAAGQKLALSEFTMERYAEQFVRTARAFLDRERQYQHVVGPRWREGRLQWRGISHAVLPPRR